MQSSLFNVRVSLADVRGSAASAGSDDVFLMNTFTDAQLVVSSDVAALLDRLDRGTAGGFAGEELAAIPI